MRKVTSGDTHTGPSAATAGGDCASVRPTQHPAVAHGGIPPSITPSGIRHPGAKHPATRPRASGPLPWDRPAPHGHNPSPAVGPHPDPPAPPGPDSGQVVDEEEEALLEELEGALEEALATTVDSKTSRSTAESTVTTFSELGQCEVTSEVDPVTSGGAQPDPVPLRSVGPGDSAMSRVEGNDEKLNIWTVENDSNDLSVQGHRFGRQESTVDKRTPRYGGQFSNYADMLDQLDDEDPFRSEQRPASHRKPPSRSASSDRPRNAAKQHRPASKPNFERRRGKDTSAERAESKRLRHLRKSKSEDTHDYSGGGGGFTNPAYEAGRRDSTGSTRTYVVGRTDSRVGLVENGQPPPTPFYKDLPPILHGSVPSLLAVAGSITDFFDTYIPPEATQDCYDLDERSTTHYIQANFRHRQCSNFIPTPKDASKCGCGREDWMHSSLGVSLDLEPTASEWKAADHTSQIKPNSFGTIAFHGFGQEMSRCAPYLRVEEPIRQRKESLQTVWELLSKKWQLTPPKMLVSVTGGAKRFFMKNRLKNSFKRGLINVASSSGAWIITGGTGTGVMQFVGEAVRDHQLMSAGGSGPQVVALGIATWGIIDNKQALISNGEGNFPAHYSIEHLSNKKGTAPLDQNHTHFLLVDDGTHCMFGKEILFRAGLESYISNHLDTGISHTQRVHVPVVLLVLEGGVNTLETVFQALEKRTPVVIIQGSGRAADFIALAYKEIRGWDDESKLTIDESIQRLRAENMFDWKDDAEKATGVEKVLACLKKILTPNHRTRVTVFFMDDVDTTKEIDEAILFSLLKAKRSDAQQQLNLALAWNRCDVARQQIFDIENRSNWQTLELNKSMLTALLQDRTDFVQLFMDNGVDLTKFLTRNTLRQLYAEVVNDKFTGPAPRLLGHLLQQAETGVLACLRREQWQQDMPNLLRVVGRVINAMLGEHNENLYKDPKYIITVEEQQREAEKSDGGPLVVTKMTAANVHQTFSFKDGLRTGILPDQPLPMHMRLYARRTLGNSGADNEYEDDFNIPERDLFLWAVLLNRRNLARLFWRAGQDHIGGALVASSILKSLSDQASDEEELDLAQDLLKHSEEWEETAVGVLTECYQRDKDLSHDLLVRENPTWGHSTLFVMAHSAEQMDFMGHSCCQTKLNRIWRGKMALYTSTWKILLCMFFPIFIPVIRFASYEFAEHFKPKEKRPDEPCTKTSFGSSNQISPAKSTETSMVEKESHFVRSPTRRKKHRASRDPKDEADDEGHKGCCSGTQPLTLVGALVYFHQAPVTKFTFHTLSYLIFVVMFSYFVLTDLSPVSVKSPSIIEYIVWGWAGTMFVEETRQLATQDAKTFSYKLSGYFESTWNRYDLTMHMMLVVSIILRHLLPAETFMWARIFYALTLSMYYLRFMHFFFVEKNIGPKVIMIRRMLTDLAFFIAILLTALLAYGVAVQALRFPNSDPSWALLKEVVYKPYWNIYGELFLEELEGEVDNCSDNEIIWRNATSGMKRCPQKNALVLFFLVVYMMMTNILLLNLLIAMFSYTFERVQENSEKVWRYYFYGLVYEYFDKPTLAPPLIIISHFQRVIKYFWRRSSYSKFKGQTDFRKKLTVNENRVYTAFERSGMENYLVKKSRTDREHIDAKVSTASDRIEKVIEDLEQIKEQVSQTGGGEQQDTVQMSILTARDTLGTITPRAHGGSEGIAAMLRDRVVGLEQQLSHQTQSMEKMMRLLKEMKSEQVETARCPPGKDYVDGSAGSVSSMSRGAYRRAPYHVDPHIEIQDVNIGDTST